MKQPSDDEIDEFLGRTALPDEWPSREALRAGRPQTPEDTFRLILLDHVYVVRWVSGMLGIPSGQDTHDEFLRAVARAAIVSGAGR